MLQESLILPQVWLQDRIIERPLGLGSETWVGHSHPIYCSRSFDAVLRLEDHEHCLLHMRNHLLSGHDLADILHYFHANQQQ